MSRDEFGPPSGGRGSSVSETLRPREGEWRLLPGLLAAMASVFLVQSGFLGILFMVPLGFAGLFFGQRTAWRGAFLAILFNALCTLALSLERGFSGFFTGIGFFSLMALVFAWIIAPPQRGPGILRVRAAYRFVLGALAGTAGALLMLGDSMRGFTQIQAEMISSMVLASAGADAVRRSLLEQELSPERLMLLFNAVQSRGGFLGSLMVILFINRQLSLAFAAFMRLRRGRPEEGDRSLAAFHVPARLIWVFSLSLGAVLLFRILGLGLPETLAWNCLTVCALMYLAQGFGITRFFLSRQTPGRRLLLNIGVILAIFSPGINAAALGLLLLLGVAEHWAPLRVARAGPPPTPAA